VDGTFIPWSEALRQHLLNFFPLAPGNQAIADNIMLKPKWALRLTRQVTNGNRDHNNSNHSSSSLNHPPPISDMIVAKLESNIRLTPVTHWQDVRLLTFTTLPVHYGPGDIITIYPKNFPHDVDEFLSLMEWTSIADEPVDFIPTCDEAESYYYPPSPFAASTAYSKLTLRALLTDHLDFNAIPRRSFFAAIAHFTQDNMQKERLVEFTKPEFIDELYDYTTRPRRSITEVLQEFATVKIPLEWLASVVPAMRGRQFSIGSGGHLKVGVNHRGRIELLVAIVKYRTVIKKTRQGLCTRYLAALSPGTELNILLSKGGLKVAANRPAVMIGPGTGIAPLRSMLYERTASMTDSGHYRSDHVLFFGGRNRAADFFFENEWDSLKRDGGLQIFPAFSRDQVGLPPRVLFMKNSNVSKQVSKVYVQDLIRAQSSLVYALLQEGVVYVCG